MTNYKKTPIARPGISNKFTLHIGRCCSLYLLNIQTCHPRNDGLAWTLSQKVLFKLFLLFWLFFFIQLLFRIREQLGLLTQNDLSPFFYKPQSNTGVTQWACISCSWMQPTTAVTGLMKGTQTHILNNHAVKPHDEEKWPLHKAYDVQAVGSTLWEY